MNIHHIHGAALGFATVVAGLEDHPGTDLPLELALYAIDRKHPKPEVLARKFGEMTGHRFPGTSLDDLPVPLQRFWTLYGGTVQLMAPWWNGDRNLPTLEEDSSIAKDAFAASKEVLTVPSGEIADQAGMTIGEAEDDKAKLAIDLPDDTEKKNETGQKSKSAPKK